jgi:hypothetical protein
LGGVEAMAFFGEMDVERVKAVGLTRAGESKIEVY